MERYKNLSNESGVLAYKEGEDFIQVKFTGSDQIYTYSYSSAGLRHIEKMKSLARKGKGLSTYISKYVKDKYE